MPVIPFKDKTPKIGKNCFIAPNAWVIGDVTLGDNSSVFFGAVIRGDINPIIIGQKTNIQENVIIHTSRGRGPCTIGNEVTIGHAAVLHGCTIENEVLIGISAVVLDDAIVRRKALIGANSLVAIGKEIPESAIAHGSPAKEHGTVNDDQRHFISTGVDHYQATGQVYNSYFQK